MMGLLVAGQWQTDGYDSDSNKGRFIRTDSQFRDWITPDGSAEPGRYHLYVSLACPWAHRTLIFRALKGLEAFVSISVVKAFMGDEGWTFAPGHGVIGDSISHKTHLHQVYTQAVPDYSGRVTVPVLWDKQQGRIVSNESADIIRMFNSAFDDVGALAGDYYPPSKRDEIDSLNEWIYHALNNGVYRAGFATTQDAYQEAVSEVFACLDQLEHRLTEQRYLTGGELTEADWRLFTTLIRFDAVYVQHFKCNKKRIVDYPALLAYLRDLYQQPGIAATVDLAYIKEHYFTSHESINPTQIIPIGPRLDFTLPHGRDHLATDKAEEV